MLVYGIVGWKNGGKTTLTERLVAHYRTLGIEVSTVKHAHHRFDIDHRGRDSWRHREAGAREVLVASATRWALISELRDAEEPSLEALLAKLAPVDLVLVEGFKHGSHPRLEAWREATGREPLAQTDTGVRAVACDSPPAGVSVPILDLDDITGIAGFILRDGGLCGAGQSGAGDDG